MKKLVLMLAVAFSMSFFACGNKEAAAEAAAEEAVDTVVVVEAAAEELVDTLTQDTVVAEVVEAAEAPVAE